MNESQVDCIIRFHDGSRIMELERCIFSLIGQTHSNVHIILATQRFSVDEQDRLRAAFEPMLSTFGAPALTIVNWQFEFPRDARTELLNLGLGAVTGRYVAFLDYDDTLYPQAYETLMSRLENTSAAIAFASVRTVKVDVYTDFVNVVGPVKAPFAGSGLFDLIRGNFCPIHSYMIDRARLPKEILAFDTALNWEEDYDFLLRICAYAPADFELLGSFIGDYYFKTDGSNSIWTDDMLSASKISIYREVAARIEMRRQLTRISADVQAGLDDHYSFDPELTIRGLLERLDGKPVPKNGEISIYNEYSNLIQPPKVQGDPKTLETIALSRQLAVAEVAARRSSVRIAELELALTKAAEALERTKFVHAEEIRAIYESSSWRATKPLRWVKDRILETSVKARHLSTLRERHGGIKPLLTRGYQIFIESGYSGMREHLKASSRPLNDYVDWVLRYDTLDDFQRVSMRRRIEGMTNKHLISIVMPTYNPNPVWLAEAIRSVQAQLYPFWELCIADDASPNAECRSILQQFEREDSRIKVVYREKNGHISAASNSALALATGQWIALMDHDDLLPEHALFHVAEAIQANPTARLIYSDEDKIDVRGERKEPYFKSDWNIDLFYSQNMFSHLGVFEATLMLEVGGFRLGMEGSQDYDLVLRCIEHLEPRQVVHIPRILYHWRVHSESTAGSSDAKPYAQIAGERALNSHFQRTGIRGRVEFIGHGYRAHYDLPVEQPLASIIIPTRNALALVRQCVESIIALTDYSNYEIVIVDNGSDDVEALEYFEIISRKSGIRILRDDRDFNYSALNNRAVAMSAGAVVALVNNDIEVISPEWLSEMVSIALQPGVGAVGAKLWYPDDTLQHGGVVLGMGGVASHAHKTLPKGQLGYFGRADLIQSFSAVTAACLVVRKEHYEAVGGLDEDHLKVAFNDIDFCLRLREAGLRNVWTPYAQLYHHESATRGDDVAPEKQKRFNKEIQYMQARWGDTLQLDPFYNPNLTLSIEDFGLAWPPRITQ
ncbi:glycosyltransferase [Variovorax sp. RHLX14]|uniref:glycosyltransferase n=1 Tax=Variovorax sp. RHLX14 TaxID=1259731 RepID=UPI003F47B97C